MGETVWDGQNRAIFDTPDLTNYQPWRNVVRGKHTCTGDICVAQDRHFEENSLPINRKNIATTLHKWSLLRLNKSIQISPNGKFCSIRFTMKSVMETFCTEGLVLSDIVKIYFKPDYKPMPRKKFTFISFINVPEERRITEYVNQNCHVHGVHYPIQSIKGIEYRTGTRIYCVSNIREHFPRSDHIFGRWCRVIYGGQPSKEKRRSDVRHCDEPIDLEMKPTNDQPNDDEDNNNNKSPQIIQETRPSQIHTPVIEETPHSQMPSTSVETTSSTEKSPQTQ